MKNENTRVSVTPPLLIRWWMDFWGYEGLATPWNVIYIRRGDLFTIELLTHEREHINQMIREGVAKFLVKYIYYWFKVGYDNNPYELEAREAAKKLNSAEIDVV
jgi:hypothetical protein